ncbi:MAG: efflux transporter periplasmic adaptor subunit [Rickettsiales bacterium]|nr:efflux transporter periplasmic adaptor subunit [Rickettsiales bacterium]
MEVEVAHPATKRLIEWDEYTGRFRAIEHVELQARVSGYLDEILFEDGQMVEKGDVLFVIDPRPYKIARDQAAAELQRTRKDYERARILEKKRAIPTEELDRRRQDYKIAQSQLDAAELDLEFTNVEAPVSGRVSRNYVSAGNYITGGMANATLLTTIVSLKPIYFYFEASERELLKYIRLSEEGSDLASREASIPVYAKLQDEETFTHTGFMDFIDNAIDLQTGTIQGRAIFENAGDVIQPGMFGRAKLPASEEYEALLVPDTIIGTDQSRKFVYTLTKDNTVGRKFIKQGPLEGDFRIVREGLATEDIVLTKNLQKIRPGMPITPKMVELDVSKTGNLPDVGTPDMPVEESHQDLESATDEAEALADQVIDDANASDEPAEPAEDAQQATQE